MTDNRPLEGQLGQMGHVGAYRPSSRVRVRARNTDDNGGPVPRVPRIESSAHPACHRRAAISTLSAEARAKAIDRRLPLTEVAAMVTAKPATLNAWAYECHLLLMKLWSGSPLYYPTRSLAPSVRDAAEVQGHSPYDKPYRNDPR